MGACQRVVGACQRVVGAYQRVVGACQRVVGACQRVVGACVCLIKNPNEKRVAVMLVHSVCRKKATTTTLWGHAAVVSNKDGGAGGVNMVLF